MPKSKPAHEFDWSKWMESRVEKKSNHWEVVTRVDTSVITETAKTREKARAIKKQMEETYA